MRLVFENPLSNSIRDRVIALHSRYRMIVNIGDVNNAIYIDDFPVNHPRKEQDLTFYEGKRGANFMIRDYLTIPDDGSWIKAYLGTIGALCVEIFDPEDVAYTWDLETRDFCWPTNIDIPAKHGNNRLDDAKITYQNVSSWMAKHSVKS